MLRLKPPTRPIHVLIAGGGISGLTLANLLVHGNKQNKFHVTIFESRPDCGGQQQSIGGGIGMWPPSQSVLKNIPHYEKFIKESGFKMPFPSYRDSSGRILARAKDDFSDRFPIQCLNRDDLLNFLLEGIKNRDDVEIVNSQKITDYERQGENIVIIINGKAYRGDLLVACDGIHSKIRNNLMSELKLPPVTEQDLGYTYFRANTLIPESNPKKWWSTAFETWGDSESKQHGNHEIRFGYVPLKPPHVFWFIAVKNQANHKYLSPIKNVQIGDEDTKNFLKELVHSWKPVHSTSGDEAVNYEELIDLTDNILRTDIAKIKGVEKFPWTSRDNRVILLGDAAHATAPNLAQGAGLCIEDAACLVSKLNRVDYLQGISEYELERKPRAKTVQDIADMVATVGQTQSPFLKSLRNGFMRTTHFLFPSLQQSIFEYAVSYSLGGSSKSPYYQPPQLSHELPSSILTKVSPISHLLNKEIKDFKNSKSVRSGTGSVTVEKSTAFAKLVGKALSFPGEMKQQPFYAEIIPASQDEERWTRIFGVGTPHQKTYSTTHSTFCDFNRKTYLSEGAGGSLDKAIQFIYEVTLEPNQSLKYESKGMTIFNSIKLPFPTFLLPKSEWIENPTKTGWEFNGKVSFPFIGTLMHYHGHFDVNPMETPKNKRIIIAGGSGMIGREVCLEFIKKGYDVYCLSRSEKTKINIEGVKVRHIDKDWSDLIDKDTIILNLSGENPGARRWTSTVKSKLAESRFKVIDNIIYNIDKASEKPLKFLQASATGFYGDADNMVLTEESKPMKGNHSGTQFRVELCEEIEKRAEKADCNVVNLRIGHVLSNTGGLLPYCRYSGFFSASRFGSGNQFVPFVHIRDVARAIEFIASNNELIEGAVNITAPESCSNSELLKELRLFKWIPGMPLPNSVLKLLFGDSSVVLTDSERVQPKRLQENGFEFNYDTISKSLRGLK